MTASEEPGEASDGIRQFGARPDRDTADHPAPRRAAHAVVLDGDRILVVDDGVHCHLPGGPVPDAEDTLAALRARVHATTGYELVEPTLFQRARRWRVDDAGRPVNEECHFYRAGLEGRTSGPLPAGGATRWAPRDAALDLMEDETSRWVLSVALLAEAVTGGFGTRPGSDRTR